MSLRYEELQAIAAELTQTLSGTVVHRVTAPSTTSVYLELRYADRVTLVHVCSEPDRARLSVVDGSRGGPWTPWEAALVAELSWARLTGVGVVEHGAITLDFGRALRSVKLVLEFTETPSLVLVADGGVVRATSAPPRAGLVVGTPWAPPSARPYVPQPMRLERGAGECPLSRAAERLFEKQKE